MNLSDLLKQEISATREIIRTALHKAVEKENGHPLQTWEYRASLIIGGTGFGKFLPNGSTRRRQIEEILAVYISSGDKEGAKRFLDKVFDIIIEESEKPQEKQV